MIHGNTKLKINYTNTTGHRIVTPGVRKKKWAFGTKYLDNVKGTITNLKTKSNRA